MRRSRRQPDAAATQPLTDAARAVGWADLDSGVTGSFTAPAGSDVFFAVTGADPPHRIRITSGTQTQTVRGRADACGGKITVAKQYVRPGAWREVDHLGHRQRRALQH